MKSQKNRVPTVAHQQDVAFDLPKNSPVAPTRQRFTRVQCKGTSQAGTSNAIGESNNWGRRRRFSEKGERESKAMPQNPPRRNNRASVQAWTKFAQLDSTRSLLDACEIIHICQNAANGVDNVRLGYNVRSPTLMAKYASRAILAGIRLAAALETRSRSRAMERDLVAQIMAWHRSKGPKHHCIKDVLTELAAEWKQVHINSQDAVTRSQW